MDILDISVGILCQYWTTLYFFVVLCQHLNLTIFIRYWRFLSALETLDFPIGFCVSIWQPWYLHCHIVSVLDPLNYCVSTGRPWYFYLRFVSARILYILLAFCISTGQPWYSFWRFVSTGHPLYFYWLYVSVLDILYISIDVFVSAGHPWYFYWHFVSVLDILDISIGILCQCWT